MQMGIVKFKRSVGFPMWHRDHLCKVSNIRVNTPTVLRLCKAQTRWSSDKTLYPQQLIQQMSADVVGITPTDIRELRAQRLRHIDYFGLVNEGSFDEKNLVEDMKD